MSIIVDILQTAGILGYVGGHIWISPCRKENAFSIRTQYNWWSLNVQSWVIWRQTVNHHIKNLRDAFATVEKISVSKSVSLRWATVPLSASVYVVGIVMNVRSIEYRDLVTPGA